MHPISRRKTLALFGATVLSGAGCSISAKAAGDRARNVMLFIADGASWGTWQMASYYEHGALGRQPYDRFSVKLGMSTQPLNTASRPTHDSTPLHGYDTARAWDTTPVPGSLGLRPRGFAGYDYLRSDVTDSAAAGTAMASGVKTYNSAINHDNQGRALPYVTQRAKAQGKATGVLSTVPFSHATPATFAAQAANRNDYAAISEQMLANPAVDLIMGAGHPLFDANGRPRSEPDFRWMSEAAWRSLRGPQSPRRLIQTGVEFEALATGRLRAQGPLLGLLPVHDTLQASRVAALAGVDPQRPSGTAFNPGLPSLAVMTRGALQVLGRAPQGFFMMVEGGAVDWMAHANNTGRIIEEQIDFNHAVQAAVDWVEAHSNWRETLIVVATDHGNGLPLGPDSDRVPFQPVQNRGAGVLPGVLWHHGNHTRENTLLWAHGAGAATLYAEVQAVDPALVQRMGHGSEGRTIGNDGLGRALMRLV
jgi:alkaline phosphatase